MDDETECFVTGPLVTIFRLSRWMCIAPIQFLKRDKGWCVKMSPSLTKLGHLIFFIINLTIIWTLCADLLPEKGMTLQVSVRQLALLVQGVVALLSSVPITHGAANRMKVIISALHRVQTIHTKLNYQPKPWTRKMIWVSILWVSFCSVMNLIDYAVLTHALQRVERRSATLNAWIGGTYIVYYIFFSVIQLAIILFAFVVLYIRTAFQAVNETMMQLLQDPDGMSNPKMTTGRQVHEVVRDIACAFGTACDVVRDMNRSHGAMLMLQIVASYFHLIIDLYSFISSFILEYADHFSYTHELFALFWCIFHFTNLTTVIEPCQITHMEMNATRKLVSHLMHQVLSPYDPLAVQLQQFCEQLILNDVYYKPMNVTTISRGLLLAVLGSITTYVAAMVHIE